MNNCAGRQRKIKREKKNLQFNFHNNLFYTFEKKSLTFVVIGSQKMLLHFAVSVYLVQSYYQFLSLSIWACGLSNRL